MPFLIRHIKNKLCNKSRKAHPYYKIKRENAQISKNSTIKNVRKNKSVFKKRADQTIARGSLTVEASLLLPVFLMFLLTLLQVFNVFSVYCQMQYALTLSARNAAAYSRCRDGISYSMAAAEVYGSTYICNTAVSQLFVAPSSGMAEDGEIGLDITYRIPAIFDIGFIPDIRMKNHISTRGWIGGEAWLRTGENQEEQWVYVAENGQVYHLTTACTYLNLKISRITWGQVETSRNVYGARYYPCERCCQSGGGGRPVYITPTGTAYHVNGRCSGLKRSIRHIPLSQAAGFRPCSRCAGGL